MFKFMEQNILLKVLIKFFTKLSLFMKHRVASSFSQESTTLPSLERIICDEEMCIVSTSLNIRARI